MGVQISPRPSIRISKINRIFVVGAKQNIFLFLILKGMIMNISVKRITAVLFILSAALLSVFIGQMFTRENIEGLAAAYGYAGVFFAAVLNGFNIAVPIPVIFFLPAIMEFGLNKILAFILIVLGMTCGDVLGYAIGKAGRSALTPRGRRIRIGLEKLRERYRLSPLVALFLFASFTPFPNEIVTIPIGFLDYRLKQIIPIILVGNLIFNALIAFGLFNFLEVARWF